MSSQTNTPFETVKNLESLLQSSILDNESLQKKTKELQEEATLWKEKYHHLQEQLALAKQQRFASSTEKNPHQMSLFNEAEDAEPVADEADEEEVAIVAERASKKKQPKREALPEHLPREIIEHDIAEEDKRCACGSMKERFGEEISEQLAIIPAQIKVISHVRPKYACKACEEGVTIAPMPKLLLPKSIASSSLVAYTITSKYVDHLPLYRQESIWQRYGVRIPRNTCCDWLMKTAEKCMPLLEHLKADILKAPYVQADETTAQVLNEPNRSDQQKSYIWVYRGNAPNQTSIYYEYQQTRQGKHAKAFLDTYSGYLQTDGYAGYSWANTHADITHLGCMAHARRPFVQLVKIAKKTGKAHQIVSLIKKLYAVEKQARENALSPDERYALRLEKSQPLLETIKQWLDKTSKTTSPKATIGKGITYMLNHWDELTAFLKDGMLEIDNNWVENDIRPFAVGRKNWLFSASPRGATASTLFFSLIMTCKANNIEPFAYFCAMLKKIPQCESKEDYKALLPYNMPELKARA